MLAKDDVHEEEDLPLFKDITGDVAPKKDRTFLKRFLLGSTIVLATIAVVILMRMSMDVKDTIIEILDDDNIISFTCSAINKDSKLGSDYTCFSSLFNPDSETNGSAMNSPLLTWSSVPKRTKDILIVLSSTSTSSSSVEYLWGIYNISTSLSSLPERAYVGYEDILFGGPNYYYDSPCDLTRSVDI